MRTDIQSINEAYLKATNTLTEGFNVNEVQNVLKEFDRKAAESGAYGDYDFNKFMEFLNNHSDNIEHVVNALSDHYAGRDGEEVNIEEQLKELQTDLENIANVKPAAGLE
jgi:hypothetical protein